MKHVAFPFLTLDTQYVDASAWCLLDDNGGMTGLGDHLPAWDYARDLRISRQVGIADGPIGSSLGLGDKPPTLEVVVRLGTGPGSMPRRSWIIARAELEPGAKILVDHSVPGKRLSQRMWLQTSIVLPLDSAGSSRFAPWREGSILWRDEVDVKLEGDSPRFPMEIVSFKERFAGRLESHALWHLHWKPGALHRDFGGSVRLFLNHDREDFIERFVGADQITLQSTLADVITQVLENALRQDDLEELLDDCESTSVAGHVATWLELAFPGQDVSSVRNTLESSPGHFHSAILAMADPGVVGADQ